MPLLQGPLEFSRLQQFRLGMGLGSALGLTFKGRWLCSFGNNKHLRASEGCGAWEAKDGRDKPEEFHFGWKRSEARTAAPQQLLRPGLRVQGLSSASGQEAST